MLMSGRSLQDRMMSMRSSRWNRSFVRSLMEWEMSCKNNVNCQKSHGMGNVLLTEWEMSCKNNVNCQKPHRMGNVLQEHYQYFSTPSTLANREPLAQTDWIRQVLACDYKCSVVWPCIQGSTDTTLSPKKPHLQEHSEALKRTCCRQPTS